MRQRWDPLPGGTPRGPACEPMVTVGWGSGGADAAEGGPPLTGFPARHIQPVPLRAELVTCPAGNAPLGDQPAHDTGLGAESGPQAVHSGCPVPGHVLGDIRRSPNLSSLELVGVEAVMSSEGRFQAAPRPESAAGCSALALAGHRDRQHGARTRRWDHLVLFHHVLVGTAVSAFFPSLFHWSRQFVRASCQDQDYSI